MSKLHKHLVYLGFKVHSACRGEASLKAVLAVFVAVIVAGCVMYILHLFPKHTEATSSQVDATRQPHFFLSASKADGDVIGEGVGRASVVSRLAVEPPTREPTVWYEGREYRVRTSKRLTLTAYSSTVDQTDDTPFITASGTHVRWGIVATNFLPIGTKVRIPSLFGEQIFVVEDRMNERYHYRMDVWMHTRQEAKNFGIKTALVEILTPVQRTL